MSPTPDVETATACLARSKTMLASAQILETAGDEWYAVCYFYAAYHTVRAAILDDPLFRSLPQLAKVKDTHRLGMTMDDRYMQRHQGRIANGTRSVGINDVVRALYPSVAVEYFQLHGASIDVRYKSGLSPADSIAVKSSFEHVDAQYLAGELAAPILP